MSKTRDTERLDFLQRMTNRCVYTGRVVFRWSENGRGWRLHETSRPYAVADVRAAIDQAMLEEELTNDT